MRARAHASAVGQASDGVRTLDLPRPAASQLTKFCSLHLHLYKNTRLEAPLIPSGSLACVAYNTIREVENARSKFRQETFETLAKFNVTKFRVVFVLFFFANRCKPLCSVNVYASDRCRWKKPYRKKKNLSYGHQCTGFVHSQNLPTQQHGRYSTSFPPFLDKEPCPVPFSSSRARSAKRRSVRQFIELSVRAGLWLAKVPSGFEMAYVAVAQAFAFFSICVSIVAMTEKKGLFVSNA